MEFDFYINTLTVYMHHTQRVDKYNLGDGNRVHFGGDETLVTNFIQIMYGKGSSNSSLNEGLFSVLMCLQARESASTNTFRSISWDL